ncbi:competence protein ComK [Sporosarcina sp. E16_8]|uniref:competence protein ComK n=1 Tax=Sporosarcina sp. E16_8 TaxID=2789295 RepID=UPI001A925C80|nr:competence protein ComK [Sporosarcina sp. E16_8]MBO0588858.1 competence protein ComK [Sporosarcina sp. E16_8]
MDKKRRKGSYIVSFDTLLLQPVFKENNISTQVIERNGHFHISQKPIHVVRKSCDYYGGSLQNSTNSAKLAIGKRHKTPIIIAHDFGVPFIFLPTMSPNSRQNAWIAYSAIDNIEADNMGCIIYLENGLSFKFDVSATTMYRQFAVATLLEKNFLKKQRQLNRPSKFDFPDEY